MQPHCWPASCRTPPRREPRETFLPGQLLATPWTVTAILMDFGHRPAGTKTNGSGSPLRPGPVRCAVLAGSRVFLGSRPSVVPPALPGGASTKTEVSMLHVHG